MNEQLLGYLFDDKPATHRLARPMGEWMDASPRFKAFATTYRDKIRKKIRVTQSSTAIHDLEIELAIAYWLLQEPRFSLAYEPYNSDKTRGPDFAVSFKSLTFNVEVTRIAFREGEATSWVDAQQVGGRLADTVADKLGQMRAGMINVLIVVTDRDFARLLALDQAMARLRERAERKEASLFSRHRFVNAADFFKYYLRLSGVLVRPASQTGETAADETAAALWINKQAKQALPNAISMVLLRE
jgi:hypothetical protein